MNKVVEAWNKAISSPESSMLGITKAGDALAAEVERLESALRTIAECSDLKYIG